MMKIAAQQEYSCLFVFFTKNTFIVQDTWRFQTETWSSKNSKRILQNSSPLYV